MEEKKFDNSKFKRLRQFLGWNQTEFAAKVDSSQQIIAMIENNRRGVPSSIREAFYNTFKLSYDDAINCESPEELNVALNTQLINNCIKNKTNTNAVLIPFYSVSASAGSGEILSNNPEKDMMYFDKRWLKNVLGIRTPEHLSIIQAIGDSMDGGSNPIKDGDLLLIDCSVKEGNNSIFIIRHDGLLRVKKLRWKFNNTLDIISNNPNYSVETLDENSDREIDFEIIGKVIWNGSKENI